jgi:trypsin-like peptidase
MSAGVARIILRGVSNRGHAGMGIVLDNRHILTCAHVLNAAIGRRLDATAQPGTMFEVDFPFYPQPLKLEGTPIIWKPMGEDADSDIALLTLNNDIPPEVGHAYLLERCDLRTGAPLAVFGAPTGEPEGQIALGSYIGRVEKERHQFDGGSFASLFVKRGYSGAAVWDDRRFVVGMTTSRYGGAELSALMTPVEVIRRVIAPVISISIGNNEPERSSLFSLGKGKEKKNTVTGDAISLYARYVADVVQRRMPEATIKTSKYAGQVDDQRFFYIADAAHRLNTLASKMIEDDAFPLSYELFFHEERLHAATNFDIGLIWSSESDAYLFGVYDAQARMERYVDDIRAELPGSVAVDFLRIDSQGDLEIGYNRQIARNNGTALIKDRPMKRGSASAAEDIMNLREYVLPLLFRILLRRYEF